MEKHQTFDAWLQIGQLDPEDPFLGTYLQNEKLKVIRTKNGVTEQEARAWCDYYGWREAEKIEAEDPSLYVCYFYTLHDANWKGKER